VTIAQFTFDGDGARVKSVMGSDTILFVGNYFEQKGSTVTKYYFAGAGRIALRKYTIPQNMTVEYMLGDHLGSTSITTDNVGAMISEIRYKPWGETRYTWTDPNLNTTPTYELPKYTFTNQYSYTAEFGLMFYGARWLDTTTGRFAQADTVVPPGVQGYDRYAYTRNNPVRYIDPSGHQELSPCSEAAGGCDITEQVEAEDQADAEYFRQRTNALRCQSGETTYCSYGEQHPVEVFLFAVGGMAGATAIEAFILEGGAAAVSEVAYWRAVLSCLRSAICRTITGMAGGAGSKLSSYQIGQNGVKQVLETLDDPSAQTEQTLTANGLSGRFDIATDTTLNEVKNVANLSLSQRFMEQAMRYSTIAEGLGKPLHYWLVNDKPQYIVDWLQNLGITVH
jgi:RHS repeat-associated protein